MMEVSLVNDGPVTIQVESKINNNTQQHDKELQQKKQEPTNKELPKETTIDVKEPV